MFFMFLWVTILCAWIRSFCVRMLLVYVFLYSLGFRLVVVRMVFVQLIWFDMKTMVDDLV